MIDFQKSLETEKVMLRPICQEDFDEMKELTKDEKVWDYFTSNLAVKEQLFRWIQTAVEAMNNQERMAFSIIDKEHKKIIGSTSLGNFSERDQRIEIGWTWLAASARGTGMNQHVKKLLLRYCFEELKLERVESKTDVLNLAARKGLQKSGLTEEGVLRSHTLLANGRRRDSIFYGILKNEWFESQL
ncbi:MAG: GNAT family protein [Bacteroidota bacterium]|nr:GNAT family N-acetyltransferase [Christiangramia sp.]MEE2772877.1 GNAT family protein [Bacteroidota bacterium]|tara:strand:- start:651 stop:1211 length:561 start_codon:yes stop_codon:yes gene_type:complete